MGLFSFGSKEAARDARSASGVKPRERRTERRSGQETLLDPTLPEKQRARRRLVGAVALVLSAVVVLPMVLDSHPRPAGNDIAVDIPSRVAHPRLANVAPHVASSTQGVLNPPHDPSDQPSPAFGEPVAPGSPATSNSAKSSAPSTASAPASALVAPNTSNAHRARTGETRGEAARPASAPAAPLHADTPPRQVPGPSAAVKNRPAAGTPSASASTPAADGAAGTAPASRFVIQLGVSHNEQAARAWVARLKAAGVPAYVEQQKLADGGTRTLVRAGPFADRAAAETAVRKVREAGLAGGAGA